MELTGSSVVVRQPKPTRQQKIRQLTLPRHKVSATPASTEGYLGPPATTRPKVTANPLRNGSGGTGLRPECRKLRAMTRTCRARPMTVPFPWAPPRRRVLLPTGSALGEGIGKRAVGAEGTSLLWRCKVVDKKCAKEVPDFRTWRAREPAQLSKENSPPKDGRHASGSSLLTLPAVGPTPGSLSSPPTGPLSAASSRGPRRLLRLADPSRGRRKTGRLLWFLL